MVQGEFEGCPLGFNQQVNPRYGPDERVEVNVGTRDSGYKVFATESLGPFPDGTPRCFLLATKGLNMAVGACNDPKCLRRLVKQPYPPELS